MPEVADQPAKPSRTWLPMAMWIVCAIATILVLYVLSFGPVVAFLSRGTGKLKFDSGGMLYRPLWALTEDYGPCRSILIGYAEWWLDRTDG